jgi:hypothetical protein
VSRRSVRRNTRYLRIWGTHLRWAALCGVAWGIIFSGRAPLTYTTPPVVEEYRSIHDEMVRIVRELFDQMREAISIYQGKDAEIEYSVKPGRDNIIYRFVLRPDLYVLWSSRYGLVNIVVEVTTRVPTHIPSEWLTAYSLGYYIRNLRPTFTLLITPGEAKILPLSTKHVENLWKLINGGTRRKPTPSLCYNCDLRTVCPEPLV